MSDYPGALDSYTAKTDNVDSVLAADVNELQNGIVAIETELGTDPAGSATDLKTRLSKSLSDAGYLKLADTTLLTISSGAVTKTQNFHRLDTEGAAASDDLDTISGLAAGDVIFLRIVASARNVVLKHDTGNLYCVTGADITLDLVSELAIGIYDDVLDRLLVGKLTG